MNRYLLLCSLLLLSCSATSSVDANVYDAVAILGFGSASRDPLPAAEGGEVIVRYNGWSLRQLAESKAGKRYFVLPENPGGWVEEALPPGIYHLKPSEKTSPVLMASALLAYRVAKGPVDFDKGKNDPLLLMADIISCNKGRHPYGLIGLYWGEDKLYLEQDYCHIQGGGMWETKI